MPPAPHALEPAGSAYGFTLRSSLSFGGRLLPPRADWPALTVLHAEDVPGARDRVDADTALVTLADGRRLGVDRASATATLHGAAVDGEVLAHPYLGALASVAARWLGREVFHAGSVAVDDRAYCLVGASHAGKTTLLGALTAAGHPVLADDLCFLDRGTVYAGPRGLDLRDARGASAPVRAVRDGRLRMALGPAPAALPLGGWVLLDWGVDVGLDPIAASDLLPRLVSDRALSRLASDPSAFVEMAARPAWRLRRPRDWDALGASAAALVAGVRAAG